ncbi:hypothetical protein IG631_22509 [Alternaria alternata]|jgi:hypothetical protein|nr:hypothetical protein IG631_22509 [Alternaria alternata]
MVSFPEGSEERHRLVPTYPWGFHRTRCAAGDICVMVSYHCDAIMHESVGGKLARSQIRSALRFLLRLHSVLQTPWPAPAPSCKGLILDENSRFQFTRH